MSVQNQGGRPAEARPDPRPLAAASRGGQWRLGSQLCCAGLAVFLALADALRPRPGTRETPSGLPVPRYGVTRFATVNARGGPGDDYKLLWTYRARGVPLQIVAETFDWRRVCDPDGGLAWVHRRTVEGDRRVMNTGSALP